MEEPVFNSSADQELGFHADELAVVVSSCDGYSDLWPPFFFFFFQYWGNCPYPTFLVANRKRYNDPRVSTILVGEDLDWSSNLRRALLEIRLPYVLLLLDDYFLKGPVNSQRIHELFLYMKRKGAGCLRLFPSPGPDTPCQDNSEVGEILIGARYRVSLQAAIWKKEILLELLREGESPWELEIKGSRRADTIEAPFLSVSRREPWPLLYLCTAVVRGKWNREAVRYCRQAGINIDLTRRPLAPKYRFLSKEGIPWLKGKMARLLRKYTGFKKGEID